MFLARQKSHEFYAAQGGAIAPLFGLLMLVMLFAMGISIDGARGFRTATVAGSALDAAALAAAKALRLDNLSDAELTAMARDYFIANLADHDTRAALESISVVVDRVINSVQLVADIKLPVTVSAVMGKEYLTVKVKSAAVFDVKDVEVSMMLDVSGSMDGSKIADLRAAATDLVDIMLPGDKPNDNKVAIAPFSTSVNAGSLTNAVSVGVDSRGRSQAGRNTTCVTERSGAEAFTDAAPASKMLNRKATFCPTTAVVPLTNDVDALHVAINSLQANGMTAGHLGTAWAYYLLSPNWASVFPADSEPVAYDEPTVRKVAILMTDGMFNSTYESANGSSVTQARNICDKMKTSGITVFTVGFQVPADVVPTLQYCATSPKHFYNATDGAELRKTFTDIANRLNGLRLSS
ncbi:MAG: VWA domain-containing protein [Hyphomicrobium sp.]